MAAERSEDPVMKIPQADPRTETPMDRTTPIQAQRYGEMDSNNSK